MIKCLYNQDLFLVYFERLEREEPYFITDGFLFARVMSHVDARYLTLLCNFLSSSNLNTYPATFSSTYQCFDFYESLWMLCSGHTDEHALQITTKHKGLFIHTWQTEYRLTVPPINFHIISNKVTQAKRRKKIMS